MDKIVRKSAEVSNIELFYDLIFAYAISKITATLHIVQNEHIPLINIGEFLMMMLVFWSIWTYQTVFANRFFVNNLINWAFMIIDMFLVIILSQSLSTNFQSTHLTFAGSTSLIMLSVGIQYIWKMMHTRAPNQRKLAQQLGILVLVTSLLGFISLIPFASYQIQFGIYFVSWVIAAIGPIFMKQTLENFPTKFEHLTERYSLFTLLLFGESVIAVATSINVHELRLVSVFFFILIVLLFSFYILTYDLGLNRKIENTAGIGLITVHYLIFIGLAFVAAPTELYIENEISSMFYLGITFAGLICFFAGVIGMLFYYHKGNFNFRLTTFKAVMFASGWYLVSYLVVSNVLVEMIWTTILLTVWLFLWWRNVLEASTYE